MYIAKPSAEVNKQYCCVDNNIMNEINMIII